MRAATTGERADRSASGAAERVAGPTGTRRGRRTRARSAARRRRRPSGSGRARPSRRRGRRRPGTARSRSTRSRARGRPSARARVGRRRRAARGPPTRSRRPRAGRRACGARAATSSSGTSFSQAPAPRSARHSSPRAEVVDVAEQHVRHRRAVGDGDRERVVGEAALGVQRAVDRVDDDEQARVAEVDDAALLGDRREARAVVVERAAARRRRRPRRCWSITSVRSPPSPTTPVSTHALGGSSAPRRAAAAAPRPSAGRRRASRARAGRWMAASSTYPRRVPAPLEGLTERQREVVDASPAGRFVVLGAAGTGKTHALGARHAWLGDRRRARARAACSR